MSEQGWLGRGAARIALLLACACPADGSAPRGRPGPSLALRAEPAPLAAPREIPPGRTFVIAAAGDIAGANLAQALTAELLLGLVQTRDLAAILALGDLQYPRGELADFQRYYAPAWGQAPLRALTRPVPGNHEYDQGTSDAEGYFDYWNGVGAVAGQGGVRGLGYYSFDMGDWHLVALNTSDGCREKVPCGAGSAMLTWLRRDLAQHKRRCVLAYFHHPRFQQGERHEDNPNVAPLWQALYAAGADLVLAGHDHNYQQLGPLDGEGRPDPRRGIRSFVVGTGGARPYLYFDDGQHAAASETRVAGRFGVLELELGPGRYAWRFLGANGGRRGEALASGRDECR